MKRTFWLFLSVLALGLLALPIVSILRQPLPTGRIVLATGGSEGLFEALAQNYKAELAKYGVELVTRPDIAGFFTLKSLVVDGDSGVNAGVVKGGFVGGQVGRYATEEDRKWHEKDVNGLRSIARLFLEPLWIFTRASDGPLNFSDLVGKKIWLGERALGSRWVAYRLLVANEIDEKTATLVDKEIDEDGAALTTGEADAAILLLPPDSPRVRKLLRNPALQLMSFGAEADAYVNRFPFLSKVVLNEGAVEFRPRLPKTNVTLLATPAALVVRTDMHPALAQVLAYAVFHMPKPGFEKNGEPILLYRAGEFPQAADSEFETHPGIRQVQAMRELPAIIRTIGPTFASLGLPFAVTAFLSEHGSQILLALVPILSIVLPMIRIVPAAYNWTVRQRLLVWYQRLKKVEHLSSGAMTAAELEKIRAELDDIDRHVTQIRVPLAFSSQLYDLHLHINVVRQRMMAAEAALALGGKAFLAADVSNGS